MPIYEVALPVGAKNINPKLPTIIRSSKDGDIPIVQLFGGDNFVGDTMEGQWAEAFTGNYSYYFTLISGGQLEMEADSQSGGTNYYLWLNGSVPFLTLQNSYVDVHLKVHTADPGYASNIAFYLRSGSSGNPSGDDDFIYVSLERTATPSYRILVKKSVANSETVIYAATVVTNEEGTFRIKFRPGDNKLDIYFHDGSGDIVESTDELTLASDSLDLDFTVGYPAYLVTTADNVTRTFISEGVVVDYPDTAISYDQDISDIGKGDVKCYDTMGSVTESDWRRVHSEDHDFTGDCVVENGLIRLIIDEASQYGAELYYWTGSAWSQPLDQLQVYQETDANVLSYSFLKAIESINRTESIQLKVRLCTSSTESDSINAELLITLSRGNHHLIVVIDSVAAIQPVRFMLGDSAPLRFSYLGDDKIVDQDFPASETNTTMTDNFMAIIDDISTVIGFIVTNQKPTAGGSAFYSYLGNYISLYSVATADLDGTEIHVGLIPHSKATDFFEEAEDGTIDGGSIVADGLASGGFMVELDSQGDWVYHLLVAGTDISAGRYLAVYRLKSTNQVADECGLYVWDESTAMINEEHALVSKTLTASYAFYSVIFEITAAHVSGTENIKIEVANNTASATTIKADYFLIIPIGDGGSCVQDIAHNAMREAAVNFRLTDSATFQLFSGLGLTGQLAGSVYTDAMAVAAIESAASISLSGPFTASTIKTGADNEGFYAGAGDDLRVYHDGTNTYIQNATGILYLKSIGNDIVTESVDFTTDIGGVYRVRDSDDSDVILMELDTNARTLQFGQAADKLTADLYGDLTISDYLTVNTINHATSDPDIFLVSDGGVIKYRTGAEVASDIGAVSVPLALTDLASYVQGSIIIGGVADWESLGSGTETHVLTMGAAEPYWAAAAGGTHDFDTHTGDLDLTDLGSYVQGSILKGGAGDWEALGAGTLNYVLKMGAAEPAWGQVDWSELTGSQPAPVAHNLIDTTGHPVSGLTIGHFLKALTTTTYGFAAHGLVAGDVGAYTTAQVDSAIDTDISTHAGDDDAHHALVTVAALPLTLSGQAVTFNYNTNHFKLTGNNLEVGTDTPSTDQVLTWNGSAVVWSDPTAMSSHELVGAYHTEVGLTIGHFLKATGATTFAFGAHGLGASDVGAYTTAQVDSAIDTDISTHAGDDNAHHEVIEQSDVESIITAELVNGQSIDLAIDALILTHKNIAAAHHAVYTNANAVSAVQAANPLNLTYGLTVGGDIQVNGGDVNIGNSSSIPGYLSLGTGGATNPNIKRDSVIAITLQSGAVKIEGNLVMAAGKIIYSYDISPLGTSNLYKVGTSTADKYLIMHASGFNTGDVIFGNKFVISEVERPDWNGDWDEPFEKVFAHHKNDGATPGLIFYNNNKDPIALIDEDGEFHVRGGIHEWSDVFKTMKKLKPRVKKADAE